MTPPLALALLAQASPVAPPMLQWSADCVKPVYATDQLVCSDPALIALDRRMTDLLKQLPDQPEERWIEDQGSWFRRSRLCAFKADQSACVASAYRERIAVLSALAKRTPPGEGCYAERAGSRTVTYVAAGKIAAVAVASEPGWAPFISLNVTNRSYVLRDLAGKVVFKCPAGGK